MGKQSLITMILLWFLGAGITCLIAIGIPRASTTTLDNVRHESSQLIAADAGTDDRFGTSVALCGDLALVGSPIDDSPLRASGSAYLFDTRAARRHVEKLFAHDATDVALFGNSVAMDASTAIIGAPGDGAHGEDAGAAYVFQLQADGSWLQMAKLTSSDAAASDNLGASVAIDGDLAIVGSPRKGPGAAYLFHRDDSGQWTEIAKLAPNDAHPYQQFGASVVIDGSTALVSAYGDNAAGPFTGAVYVFHCKPSGQWTHVAKLIAADATSCSFFGSSLALRGNTAVVGAFLDSAAEANAGATYVFRCDDAGTWRQVAKLAPAEPVKGQRFGRSVALAGSNIVVGSPGQDHGTGAAYLFKETGTGNWKQIAKYIPSDGSALDRFGESVAIGESTVLVGASQDNDAAPNSGSVYIFDLDG